MPYRVLIKYPYPSLDFFPRPWGKNTRLDFSYRVAWSGHSVAVTRLVRLYLIFGGPNSVTSQLPNSLTLQLRKSEIFVKVSMRSASLRTRKTFTKISDLRS